jgi:hypothetical protein
MELANDPLLASQLQRVLTQRRPHLTRSVLLILFGVWMMAAPLLHTQASGHVH